MIYKQRLADVVQSFHPDSSEIMLSRLNAVMEDAVGNAIVQAKSREGALLKGLEEIAKGEGAYSRDPLEHASNVIDNAKTIAKALLGQ